MARNIGGNTLQAITCPQKLENLEVVGVVLRADSFKHRKNGIMRTCSANDTLSS